MPDTCFIPLTQGQYATVDADMFAELRQFDWYAQFNRSTRSFYATRHRPGGGHIQMARVVLGLADDDPHEPDHAGHMTLDNRRLSLRVSTKAQNRQNRRRRSDNVSGYKGVSLRAGLHRVQIWLDGTNVELGSFTDPIVAAKVYDAAAREAFGAFACLNFPIEEAVELPLAA
jgi:hypothetical protein